MPDAIDDATSAYQASRYCPGWKVATKNDIAIYPKVIKVTCSVCNHIGAFPSFLRWSAAIAKDPRTTE